jgi:DNA (cytosine-5)-methyltransferase 1
MIRYLDVCSGYSAFTLASAGLGFRCVGYSEIEAFPRAVLEQRHGAVPVEWDHRFVPGSNTTPLFGDFTKIESHHVGPVDLLAGGTPCQAFSVAGKRLGLDDPRGNLTLEFLALARRVRARRLVWENVPGFLSHDSGRTMGTFLRLLGELGYGWAYRVLDAQYIRVDGHEGAVPQRRRRLFVVAHLGDAAGPAAVLFERESLRGDPAPRREAWEGAAGVIGSRAFGGGNRAGSVEQAACLTARGHKCDFEVETFVAHALRAEGFDASEDGTGRGTPLVPCYAIHSDALDRSGEGAGGTAAERSGLGVQPDIGYAMRAKRPDAVAYRITPNDGAYETGSVAGSLTTGTDRSAQALVQPIAFAQNSRDEVRLFGDDGQTVGALAAEPGMKQTCYVAQPIPIDMRQASRGATMTNNRQPGSSGGAPGTGIGEPGDPSPSLSTSHAPAVAGEQTGWAVRRLTPTECERLMGVPDGFTAITYRGKPAADGPRYKALGNSQAVNVMRWIAHGLADVMAAQGALSQGAA